LNLRILCKERNVRNTVVIKHDETVIDSIETKLGTDITNSDTRKRSVILQVTDLDTERMRSVILTISDKTGVDDSVIGGLTYFKKCLIHL
jgi:hypothetical protein